LKKKPSNPGLDLLSTESSKSKLEKDSIFDMSNNNKNILGKLFYNENRNK
jgi:hypothetical protein